MSSSEAPFPYFARLPPELQLAVWRECLPHRVRELDRPRPEIVFGLESRDSELCTLWQTTYLNSRPPVIAQVCRASRAVAFENGSCAVCFDDESLPDEARWATGQNDEVWLDPLRDSVHLNWYRRGYRSNFFGRPLRCLAWFAERAPLGASFMIEYLPAIAQMRRYPLCYEELDAFQSLSSWTIVTRVVIVHTDRRTGARTGLFGLLGDALVQIIDISDEARVNAYFDLAEESERKSFVTVKQDLHRNSAESIKQHLRAVIVDEFGSEEALPIIHPVIMFRLYTKSARLKENWGEVWPVFEGSVDAHEAQYFFAAGSSRKSRMIMNSTTWSLIDSGPPRGSPSSHSKQLEGGPRGQQVGTLIGMVPAEKLHTMANESLTSPSAKQHEVEQSWLHWLDIGQRRLVAEYHEDLRRNLHLGTEEVTSAKNLM